jgi:catabolite regulation protein CreA
MLIIKRDYARDLILDSDAFAFRKPSNEVPNLEGVTLHLAFAGADLLDDLISSARSASVDGITVKTVTAQGVLLAKQQQQKRFDEHQEVLKRSLSVFRKDMA